LLHPAVVHHVVNSLGWSSLRPLQSAAVAPLLAGDHAVLVAPTAGGKTEAAVFPLLSRMLSEEWRGLSVLYLCPLRALLNNLHLRLDGYATLVGRSCGLWHGDVGPTERDRLLANPPDLLLTTPESLEAMLVSRRVEHRRLFAGLRTVVVDEAHALAGDDRGWHLVAVLERISRLADRELQRVALSATVGNPGELLDWLTTTCSGPAQVIAPRDDTTTATDVVIDYVGSLDNAATVVSRLHRGEKRLVFVDSRARAERLAAALRDLEQEVFVSHGSLGRDERRRAEVAFAESADCVIVATSTLELGIDVGDLDRVIQLDSVGTVASFLQRLGRTGRRPGLTRNALFLATDDAALLQTTGVLSAWAEGYVEPVVPPAFPLHLLAQQNLALALQEQGVGRHTWPEWLGKPCVLGEDVGALAAEVTDHLLSIGMLHADGELLGVGTEGEAAYGHRHFLELLSVFTSPPVFSVRHGRTEIGLVPDRVLQLRDPRAGAGGSVVLLLAGRPWAVMHVDWGRRVVQVEPTTGAGVARWFGSAQPLGATVARAIRAVLVGHDPSGVTISDRATARLAELRRAHFWARDESTCLVTDANGRVRWWTFAGLVANAWLAAALRPLRREVAARDNLTVTLDPDVDRQRLAEALGTVDWDELSLVDSIVPDALEGLKFADCLSEHRARGVILARLDDRQNAKVAATERLDSALAADTSD
jgi:ATP-dependent helicase Lhr and Lhr-like helicase